jgi:hypothetical protein
MCDIDKLSLKCSHISHMSYGLNTTTELADLHAYQVSTEGMIATRVTGLVSTIAELNNLSASPLGLALLAAELADLELVRTEVGQLISRLYRAQGVGA